MTKKATKPKANILVSNPFSKVIENQTFFVALHILRTNKADIQKVLVSVQGCLGNLKKFKMVLILFSDQIEQIKIFTEKNISDLATFSIPWSFTEGNNILDTLTLTNSFDTTGFGKYVFIHATVSLKCGMLTQYVNALYKIVWIEKCGLDAGEHIPLDVL